MLAHFFYLGLMAGYANVDWSDVVSTDWSSRGTNPLSADGTGVLFGFDGGYQFNPFFAVEGEAIRLPTTQMTYYTVFNWPANDYNVGPVVDSDMAFASLVLKVIAPLPNSKFSLFVDAGPAYQYRSDQIAHVGTWAPTFGGGLLYRLANTWQVEGSFQYAPGTGKSVQDPMYSYVPEVYMGTLKIDYLF